MAQDYCGGHLGDILLERQMGAVDHHRADAAFHLILDVVQRFVMIQMQRQRQIVAVRGRLANADQVVGAGIAEGAGRAGHDHRRAQLGGGLRHHLHGFQIVDVKRRNGVTLALRLEQHVSVGYQIHGISLQLGEGKR